MSHNTLDEFEKRATSILMTVEFVNKILPPEDVPDLAGDSAALIRDLLDALRTATAGVDRSAGILAREIVETARRLGITSGTTPFTGPEVLLLLRDIEELAATHNDSSGENT